MWKVTKTLKQMVGDVGVKRETVFLMKGHEVKEVPWKGLGMFGFFSKVELPSITQWPC